MAPRVKIVAVTAVEPGWRMTQAESLHFILEHFPMKPQTAALYRRVFSRSGIESRAFAFERPEEVLETDPDKIHGRFQARASALSNAALQSALAESGIAAGALRFLGTATCTGYLCPGLSSYLMEACRLPPDIHYLDAAGMGCGAALPILEQAFHFLAAHPGACAATVNTEICTAAMVSDDSAELVVSNAIFADGAAACILSSRPADRGVELVRFASYSHPEWRDSLRFRQDRGRLRNVLAKEVPAQAGATLRTLCERLLEESGLRREDIQAWIVHAGGVKVLDTVQEQLKLAPDALRWSRETLRRYGNLSSATVLYTLRGVLEAATPPAGAWAILSSFGAGFSAHAALLRFV